MIDVKRTVPALFLVLSLVSCQDDLHLDRSAESPSVTATAPEAALPTPLSTPTVTPLSPGAGIEDENNTIDVFKAAAPATVFVTQKQLVRNSYTRRTQEIPAGSGSGFVWDRDGHIVTNYHVVDGGSSFTVTLFNQKSYPAELVGGEPRKDIAVLKIDAPEEDLMPITLPKKGSEQVVGQKAIAIGNPFGLDHTLTTGVVSAIGREVLGYGKVTIKDMIQTDASINPGNSGGPLLDSAGHLLGINAMIYSQSGSSAGIGFAVPVSTIRRVVPQIIETGHAEQAGLGISILSDDVARRAAIAGVIIESVMEDSPAAEAGLRGLSTGKNGVELGDVIVAIDEEEVLTYDDLYNALEAKTAGDKVKVKVVREQKEQVIECGVTILK
ncbi:MAG: 2-alkenal reductase [Deltaproteobacteria bacterium CG_4_9_14_3_um_filter_63_12]|nr:MAG: 2-alkenal reductase [Deltaproteobacteria bacterium CG_4_9_14_3_um_filter_63_12]